MKKWTQRIERELVKKTQKNKEEKFNLGLSNDNGHENIEPPIENAAIQSSTKKVRTKVEIIKTNGIVGWKVNWSLKSI